MDAQGQHRLWILVYAVLLLAGCGDGSGSGGGGTTGPSGTPGPSGATITIGANGTVSPAQVTINTGQSVTFVNNHNRSHEIASDPHPAHTACPPINGLGVIAAGQTKQTNTFTISGNCGFHDHNEPDNAGLRGTISVR